MNIGVIWLFVAGAVFDPQHAADSQPAAALSVETIGECPRHDAVTAALLSVVGKDAISARQRAPRVSDLGDRFEVEAAGQRGQYPDPARDCVERARVAAVFIALALNPPMRQSIGLPPGTEQAPAVTATAPPDSPTAVTPPVPWWTQLAVGARIDGASSANGAPADVALGGELRGTLGRGSFGILAGAGALAPTTSAFGSVSVRQQRFPFNLAVGARRRISPVLELAADAGVSLVVWTLRAEGLEKSEPATRLATGARIAFELRLPALASSVVPFLAIHAEFFPRPFLLDVDPLGEIGKTNRLWLGASAGMSFGGPQEDIVSD